MVQQQPFKISHSLATPASKILIQSEELPILLCSMYLNNTKQGYPTGWKGESAKQADFLVIIAV